MGIFSRKSKDEQPAPGSGMKSFEDGKVPWASEQETIGKPVQQTQGFDPSQFSGVGGIAGMLGGLQQVQQMQAGITIDATDPELGEKMKAVMRKYGIDPESGATGNVDASQMVAMQQEMMQVLQGGDVPSAAEGEKPKFDIQMADPSDPDPPQS